jgi:hypothetical protein
VPPSTQRLLSVRTTPTPAPAAQSGIGGGRRAARCLRTGQRQLRNQINNERTKASSAESGSASLLIRDAATRSRPKRACGRQRQPHFPIDEERPTAEARALKRLREFYANTRWTCRAASASAASSAAARYPARRSTGVYTPRMAPNAPPSALTPRAAGAPHEPLAQAREALVRAHAHEALEDDIVARQRGVGERRARRVRRGGGFRRVVLLVVAHRGRRKVNEFRESIRASSTRGNSTCAQSGEVCGKLPPATCRQLWDSRR